jgi:hypothetical protein
MMEKVTLATASGPIWLTLVAHITAGGIGLAAGTVALIASKGGQLHKRSGMVFMYAMVAMVTLAGVVSAYEGRAYGAGAVFTSYLVVTATLTVKPAFPGWRSVAVALMLAVFVSGAMMYWHAVVSWQAPGHQIAGVPAGMTGFLGTIALLAAVGDLRMIRAGGITGPRRLTRHLWRMCFALFIATGSFFLGQMKFIPAPIRSLPLMMLLGIGPLLIMIYWMVRIRLRKTLSGIILGRAVPIGEPASKLKPASSF